MVGWDCSRAAQLIPTNHRTDRHEISPDQKVMQLTGLSRMTIYRLELAGEFPKRRQLSHNSVAWREEDISHWVDTRPIAHLRGTLSVAGQARRLNGDKSWLPSWSALSAPQSSRRPGWYRREIQAGEI
jgi:prophage regulatory protein